jgi:SAM-dependent methyltransferase
MEMERGAGLRTDWRCGQKPRQPASQGCTALAPFMQSEEYLKLAAVEDQMWYFRALHRHIQRELARHLTAGRAGSAQVLDAGCGTGGLILAARERMPNVTWTGLDFSPLAGELARTRTGCPIIEGSVAALPFADGSFDGVVSADVICQIEDGTLALREFERVLRPGGVAIINVPAFRWLWSYHDDSCQTKHRYRRGELAAQLRMAGLYPQYVTYRNCVTFPVVVVKRKLMPRSKGASDVRLYPGPVEAAFGSLMAMEHAWMARRWPLPFGSSVFAVAMKTG